MEKAKSKSAAAKITAAAPPAPASATTAAPATVAPVQYRENPRTNEKIDEWIKRNPDQFKFFNEMPHERAVRKLILNEIEKYERFQKSKSYRSQKGEGEAAGPRNDNAQTQSTGGGMRVR